MTIENRNRFAQAIPITGMVLFACLFIFSSTLYPGGSQADLQSVGFDWVHNYWCNLMNDTGMNGQMNPARPFAIVAMTVLCFSLMVFFIQFSNSFAKSAFWKPTIKISGVISMSLAALIFTDYHDLMTILSSIFGLVVVIGIIWEVYKSKLSGFKLTGGFCILLLGVNNYIYYSEHFLELLPLIQKITFAIVLGWIDALNFKMTENRLL